MTRSAWLARRAVRRVLRQHGERVRPASLGDFSRGGDAYCTGCRKNVAHYPHDCRPYRYAGP